MSNTKFTPGPWVISDELRTSINTAPTEDGTYKHIAMVNWCKYREYSIVGEEHDANAHLICTAPDLYHELEDSVHLMCNNCNRCELGLHGEPLFQSEVCETYTRKVAVLRKARGE